MLPACSAPAEPRSAEAAPASGGEIAIAPRGGVSDELAPVDNLQRLDLASLIASGAVDARHNAGWNNFPRKLTDGDTGTFKTTDANPAVLEFRFQQPTTVRAVRLFVTGAPQFAWTLREGKEGLSLTADAAPADQWSLLELTEAATPTTLVIEIRGSTTDRALAVHEVEVLGPP
jgi:hypothetical protein